MDDRDGEPAVSRDESPPIGVDWETRWHAIRQLLGRKWSFHVVRLLDDGPRGFSELESELEGMTATMLSRRLDELQCSGLVERRVQATSPPSTSYRLTTGGEHVATALRSLEAATEQVECPTDACRDGDACESNSSAAVCDPESVDCACLS
ncbi:helix-turn-helix domain-containing protein [Haloarchaeobius sp. HME9146]|uniref:winged helix-turn-helix transcriptional regulator n=1 Tax=Haloarchaeobius sp. HME9146 TaxID=2978732 RepID=UPI0021C008AB|nr:helix-turn-helix domain-containing protein [Haloarchaeobius sp. HME9146]MCT9096614.1 helix-turn-helix transcriptional regulator [Haloarchaeobius sp. HME9146]